MLSLVTPARAAARSWAMTAATAASIRRGESRRSLVSRAPRASSRSTALPMWRASRLSPEWGELAVDDGLAEAGGGRGHPPRTLRILHDGQALLVEAPEGGGP